MTRSYKAANHPPRLSVRGSRFVSTKPGEVVTLRVTSSDPDGNALSLRWWRWDEADSYDGAINLEHAEGSSTRFTVPVGAKPGQTIHIVVEATDNGTPALTRYERFTVTVGS